MNRNISAIGLALVMSAAAVRAEAPRDDIKVHGQWVINVRQADGTIVEHREFHNDVLDAPRALSGLLGGTYGRLDHLRIELRNDTSSPACTSQPVLGGFFGGSPHPSHCYVLAPNVGDPECAAGGGNCFNTLTVDPPGTAITLHGSVVATRVGSVAAVRLVAALARPDGSLTWLDLTGINIFPVAVTYGQTIQVSVTISFT